MRNPVYTVILMAIRYIKTLKTPIHWYQRVQRRLRSYFIALIISTFLMVAIGLYAGLTLHAINDVQNTINSLENQLSQLNPVNLLQVDVHTSLERHFSEVTNKTERLQLILSPMRLFQWVPRGGTFIKEKGLIIEAGFYAGKAGARLSYILSTLPVPESEKADPSEVVPKITRALNDASPQLEIVQEDVNYLNELHNRTAHLRKDNHYVRLLDQYLPLISTLLYLTQTTPEILSHSYVITKELSELTAKSLNPAHALQNRQELEQLFQSVSQQTRELESEFVRARQTLSGGSVSNNDGILDTLVAIEQGLNTIRHFTSGINKILAISDAATKEGFLSKKFGSITRQKLTEAQQEFEIAQKGMVPIRASLNNNSSLGPTISESPDGTFIENDKIDRIELLLQQSVDTTNFIRAFLGYEGPKEYLLLRQDENEIRATGGVIGAAVRMVLNEGTLTDLIYHDSLNIDPEPHTLNPSPPDGLYWYLWQDRMLFRDSNWSPHFPLSAANVAQIFYLGHGIKVDGVITSTNGLTLDMLELIGPITVPGDRRVLSRDRAQAYIEGFLPYPCAPHHASNIGKHCFDEDLLMNLKSKMADGISANLSNELLQVLWNHLSKRNIFVHILNPQEGDFWEKYGWNGAISPVDHDFLMAIDSSVSGHPTVNISRSFEYRISLDTHESLIAQLRIRYNHSGDHRQAVCLQSEVPTLEHCYWNFLRVYIPKAARDIHMPKFPLHTGSEKLIWGYSDADSASIDSNIHFGHTTLSELSGLIVVEPNSVATIPIQYLLPAGMLLHTNQNTYEYSLLIKKQPGMDQDTVSVGIELPANTQLLQTSLPVASHNERWLLFSFPLKTDTLLTVSFSTAP